MISLDGIGLIVMTGTDKTEIDMGMRDTKMMIINIRADTPLRLKHIITMGRMTAEIG